MADATASKATNAKAPAPSGPLKGVSTLPVSRVNRIIKADPEVRLCSKEAIFLISRMTEAAVCRLASSAQQNARLKKRTKTVQYQDLAQAVQRPEWFFLQSVIPPATPLHKVIENRAKGNAADGTLDGKLEGKVASDGKRAPATTSGKKRGRPPKSAAPAQPGGADSETLDPESVVGEDSAAANEAQEQGPVSDDEAGGEEDSERMNVDV